MYSVFSAFRKPDLGHYSKPAEVIARAVALLEAEENWLLENKAAIHHRLDESMSQIERAEGISGDQLLDYLSATISTRNSKQR